MDNGRMARGDGLHVVPMMMVVWGWRLAKVVVTVLSVQGLDLGWPTGV